MIFPEECNPPYSEQTENLSQEIKESPTRKIKTLFVTWRKAEKELISLIAGLNCTKVRKCLTSQLLPLKEKT